MIGDKIPIIAEMSIKIQFENNSYDHTVYMAEITDGFILGLDFLRKCNFIDFKDNSLYSTSEGSRCCSTTRRNCGMMGPVMPRVTNSVTPYMDPWNEEEVRDAQMKDPDMKPFIEFMKSSNARPIWQNISNFSPGTKRYWVL